MSEQVRPRVAGALVNPWLGEDFDIDMEFRPGEIAEVGARDMEAARRFRDVLGRFASGVTVVTGLDGDRPVGLTCQSFSSVSLVPPLVLFCPARTSRAWPLIQRAGRFVVNLLADDQAEVSNRMASRGHDKFTGLAWHSAPVSGAPVLDGVVGYVDCSIQAVHEAGDHFVVIGRVLSLAETDRQDALTFYRGRYGTTSR